MEEEKSRNLEAKKFIMDYQYLGIGSLLDLTAEHSIMFNMIADCMEQYSKEKTNKIIKENKNEN